MALRDSAIRLTLKARDLLSRIVSKSSESLEQLESQAKGLKTRLKTLEQQSRLLSSFKAQASSVQSVSRAYREARLKVERLAREQAQAISPSKKLNNQLVSARKTVTGLSSQYQKQKQKLAELRDELARNGLSNRNLARQQNRLQAEFKQTAESLDKVQKEARQSRTALKKTGFKQAARDADKADFSVRRLGQSFRNLVLAGTGFYLLKRSIQGVLETGDKFERLAIQMEALMGSVEAGQQATEWIKDFTRSTPLQLDQVSEAFIRLKNFGIDPMDGTLQALVDQNAKLGGEFDRLQRISLAVGQAFGKTKLQGEELRQLIEAGVPVWQLLEKATGKNVTELRKFSEAGALGQDVIKSLIAEMGNSSLGAAAKNMKTMSGLVSNMKDRWLLFQKAVSDSGWTDYIKAQLTSLGNRLDELANDGKLQTLAKNISGTFIAIAESIKQFFSNLTIDEVVNSTTAGFQKIVDAAGGVITTFQILGNGIGALFNSLKLVVKGAATFITGAIAQISKAAANIVGALGFEELQRKIEFFSDGSQAVMSAFADSVVKDAEKIRSNYETIGEALTRETPKVADALAQAKASIEATGAGIEESNKKVEASQNSLKKNTEQATDEAKKKYAALKEEASGVADALSGIEDAGEAGSEGLSRASDISQAMANHMGALKSELAGMSASALAAFENLNQVTEADTRTLESDIESLRHTLEQTVAQIQEMGQGFRGLDTSGLGEWMYNTKKTSLEVKESFLEQKLAFEELMQAWENGELTAESFSRQAADAADILDFLDQQDMDTLNRALAQAERQMRSLQDSSRSTLESLQDELDRLEGNTTAIEKRRYESRKRDLEQQLAEAQSSGNSKAMVNLQQALSLNSEVFQKTSKQRKAEERLQRQLNLEKQKAELPQQKQTPVTPSKVIRLEYPDGSVNVGVNQGDDTKLLRALKQAGMRAT
ncbi:tape measure protein [Sansalvadorimonas sp. 2012CJ34-2]|uniref:Tape measure protein n=1 Tax=Parendozoicomonas callyspongiae TaxID=2942213 RepID=A0ABT0PH62_9GAMM|nr:tape measure protein [Sansalvadorimonas sp. 2012CJ34-2]MCL6270724.1 tape measure protein [Sansalvadorimonas sp. 2012CJ34-2]